jgi:hypothetical protein
MSKFSEKIHLRRSPCDVADSSVQEFPTCASELTCYQRCEWWRIFGARAGAPEQFTFAYGTNPSAELIACWPSWTRLLPGSVKCANNRLQRLHNVNIIELTMLLFTKRSSYAELGQIM